MRRWGELVLRHRLIIVIGWMVIAVAGGAVTGTVSDRMTVNFSLPGQPGDTASNKIIAAFHNGGNTSPLIATVTLAAGETITGHEAEVAKAFATLSKAAPQRSLRVVDEATTGDKAFRTPTTGRRTPWCSTRSRRPSPTSCRPSPSSAR